MIRERIAQLEQAAERAIGLLGEAGTDEDRALAVLWALAPASSCYWAAYWTLGGGAPADATDRRLEHRGA